VQELQSLWYNFQRRPDLGVHLEFESQSQETESSQHPNSSAVPIAAADANGVITDEREDTSESDLRKGSDASVYHLIAK
jgi:hypothetical protein